MVFPGKPKRQLDDTVAETVLGDLPDTEPVPKKKKMREFNFKIHPRRKIALQFLYYGWDFDGLVPQTNTDQTVEKFLLDALMKTRIVESLDVCDYSRCGRTDKGVSAYKQVAALIVRSADPSGQFAFWPEGADESVKSAYSSVKELDYIRMLNGVLPPNIRVTAWAPVPLEFSARHGCNMRIYKYSMPRANLNIEKMRNACNRLVGTHDYRNFCQIDMNIARVTMSYVREIYEVSITEVNRSASGESPYDLIELTVRGSGFLWHMIRFIVTVLHEIGRGTEQPELVSDLLNLEKHPSRPHYALGVDTPLCLFDCRFDSSNLQWVTDDYSTKKTVALLQGKLSDFITKARLIENMVSDMTSSDNNVVNGEMDLNRGLLEFTQDRQLPSKYIPFGDRKRCDSLEKKLSKLEAKKKEKEIENRMSRRKLEAIGYRKTLVDVEDDQQYRNLMADLEEVYLKRKDSDWISALLDETDAEKWNATLNAYYEECGIDASLPRKAAVDQVLLQIVNKVYSQNVPAHDLTLEKYNLIMKEKQQENQSPLDNLDVHSPDFSERVYQLTDFLGMARHPDPVVALQAACLFITRNLSEAAIEERNKEIKDGKKVKTFELRSFPLGIEEQKDGALNAAARILRLINLKSLRNTQTMINETLVAIQNISIDMSKKADFSQVRYGKD